MYKSECSTHLLVCNKTEEGTEKTSEEKFEFTQIPNQIITFKKKKKNPVHFILKKKKRAAIYSASFKSSEANKITQGSNVSVMRLNFDGSFTEKFSMTETIHFIHNIKKKYIKSSNKKVEILELPSS